MAINFMPPQDNQIAGFLQRISQSNQATASNQMQQQQMANQAQQANRSADIQQQQVDQAGQAQQGQLGIAQGQLAIQQQDAEMRKQQQQMKMKMQKDIQAAAAYGPQGIAQVYQQYGDPKTANEILLQAQNLQMNGLKMDMLLRDPAVAAQAGALSQVVQRIGSLPADQQADEYNARIPAVNQTLGMKLSPQYSPGNFIALQSANHMYQSGIQRLVSDPSTAPLAETAIKGATSPEAKAYFDQIIGKLKDQGPDIVVGRGSGRETSGIDKSISALNSEYQAIKEPTKLSPEMQRAQDTAQSQMSQEAAARKQALSNSIAKLQANKNPTAADIAAVHAQAKSLLAEQNQDQTLAAPGSQLAMPGEVVAGVPDEVSTTQSQSVNAKGEVSYKTSNTSRPGKDDKVGKQMDALSQTLGQIQGLPQGVVPTESKPQSALGKAQADLEAAAKARDALIESGASDKEILDADDRYQELKTFVDAQAKTGGGVNVSISQDSGEVALTKKNMDVAQINYRAAQQNFEQFRNMGIPEGDSNPLNVQNKLSQDWTKLKQKAQLAVKPEERKALVEGSSFLRKIDRYISKVVKGLSGAAASDQERAFIKNSYVNGDMSADEYATGLVDLANEAMRDHAFEYSQMTGKEPEPFKPITYDQVLGKGWDGKKNGIDPKDIPLIEAKLNDPKATAAQKQRATELLRMFHGK